MKFQRCDKFPVTPSVLIAHLAERRCYEMRFHLRPENPESRIELWQHSTAGLRVRVLKQVPIKIEKLPRLLRPFLAPVMPFYVEFFWRGLAPSESISRARAEYRLWIGKVPLQVDGEMEVVGNGECSEQLLRAEITSRIPLMGNAMLERALPMVNKLLDADYSAMLGYLERERIQSLDVNALPVTQETSFGS